MNPILQSKLDELEKAEDYDCWYLVKQPTDFGSLCYLVSILKDYIENGRSGVLQEYMSKKITELNEKKSGLNISDNYRALRVAAFFGLIIMTSKKYEESIISDTFNEITQRCNGEYENKDLYEDIIQRQIEKMYISSVIDEEHDGIRQEYRLYPSMLLYKVLLELGRATGEYSISITEYRYLVATTKTFADFLDTLLLIKLLREEQEDATPKFEVYRTKFDNRLIQALKQLNTLSIDRNSISLVEDRIEEVAYKVYAFEENPNMFMTNNHQDFLGSTKSLLDLAGKEKVDSVLSRKIDVDDKFIAVGGFNKIYYGAPGCGKSRFVSDMLKKASVVGDNIIRATFHPEYANCDFIGQILPTVEKNEDDEDIVKYIFNPGPFTLALQTAYNSKDMVYLIVEEINRGNAAAIFGEMFQLLDRGKDEDRDDFTASEYPVSNPNMQNYLIGKTNSDVIKAKLANGIYIPSNLTILATMNSSDQNVFTLDTAFKRRWLFEQISNDITKDTEHKYREYYIPGTNVTWEVFLTKVNDTILVNKIQNQTNEDKRLGKYFVSKDCLTEKVEDISTVRDDAKNFAYKVLEYIWNDVCKIGREDWFDTEKHKTLEDLIDAFTNPAEGESPLSVFQNIEF